jgi:hypothetical protein
MKAIKVEALNDYNISIGFEDGIKGVVNLQELVEQGIFQILKDKKKFSKVYTTGYSIAWSDELEIDALTVYAELLNKHPEDVLKSAYHYASN